MAYFKYDAYEYDRGRGEATPFWVKEAIRIASLDSCSLVLDLGCGTGNYALKLEEEMSGTVCALDPEIEMLKVGRLKDSRRKINWLRSIAERIPFKGESFDCVFSSQVWHHIRDKIKASEECYRVLKCNSPLIIRTISHEQWKEKTICNFFPEILPNQMKAYPSIAEFNKLLTNARFKNIGVRPYRLERYTRAEEFVKAAEKKLWSMFKYVSEENLRKGIDELRKFTGQPLRNDELITLIVAWK